ncbi:hypothetical protein POM88_041705 [Heracleum sosnowskyi]|uniref:Uncharacterized protein n=1 Tax=Heracleum sosnowskyi TaxID=360622 RepID=A0AAD8HFD7_9APIA|nr:hypothetical protein POM88_041705 [Heracleum sosnowskyi]
MSFLSPLFVTISLVFVALIYDKFTPRLSEPGCSFLLSAFSAVLDISSSKFAEEFEDFEEFEVYKIVFLLDQTCNYQTCNFDVVESSEAEVSEPECEEKYCLEDVDDQVLAPSSGFETRSSMYQLAETTEFPLMEEKKEMLHSTLEKEVDFPGTNFNKVLEVEEQMSKLRIGSEAKDIIIDYCDNVKLCVDSHDKIGSEVKDINIDCCDNGKENTESEKLCVDSQDKIVKGNVTNEGHALNFDNEGANLGSYGSMRKEKEWKRTLACKLYEERHHNVVEGDEGMDSLWETYESDSTKSMPTLKDVKKKSLKKKKSSDLDCYVDEDEDDDEVEMTNGHLCCLQAFKFSARKMNMGMGRTNIVKITKALRGIGWLHHIKKHDKKEKS